MRFCYMYFLVVILCCRPDQIDAKTFREEIFPSDSSKLQCSSDQDIVQTESASYDSQSHFKDGERYGRPMQFAEKRSINEISSSKKEVGVIYKNENPIGILQPAQRSYRFIPVEDNSLGFDKLEEGKLLAYIPEMREIKKRQTEGIHRYDNYPSILTNFKIGSKLDQKRNQEVAAETLNNLNSGIRTLRSSNIQNTDQIEDELKNVLDDMGLIQSEKFPEKREIADSYTETEDEYDEEISKAKNKRNKDCIDEPGDQIHPIPNHEIMDDNQLKHQTMYQNLMEKRNGINEVNRYKQNVLSSTNDKNFEEDTDELNDFGSSIQSGYKVSLPNRNVRNTDNDINEKVSDDDKTIEHQIQAKIDALKEEVKRDINLVKAEQNEDDSQRKKRQITEHINNLISEETDDIDPALNSDNDLKRQIRKRRAVADLSGNSKHSYSHQIIKPRLRNSHLVRKKRNQSTRDNSGDVFEDDKKKDNSILKRNIFSNSHLENNLAIKNIASLSSDGDQISYLPQNIYKDQDGIRQQADGINTKSKLVDNFKHDIFLSPRFRRRINEKGIGSNRPQQLSDMSDFDIFGALPKSYDGELSRYKRVKRK